MLEFNTQVDVPEASTSITGIDPEGLMNRLVAAGYMFLDVTWESLGLLRLPVEDDAMFLCEAYQELGSFAQAGDTQHVFLGDGEIDMVARRENDLVHVTCTHTPFLHRALSTTKAYTVPIDAYVGAWTRLIRALIELADQPGPLADRTNTNTKTQT